MGLGLLGPPLTPPLGSTYWNNQGRGLDWQFNHVTFCHIINFIHCAAPWIKAIIEMSSYAQKLRGRLVWYAHPLLIKNNQEKHALNSKMIKNRANERLKLKELRTGRGFRYFTALMSYCLDKNVFAGHLFSCYSFVRLHVSQTERKREIKTAEERMRTKLLDLNSLRSRAQSMQHTRTHKHTHIHTRIPSGLIHMYLVLVCRQLQTEPGKWHQ